MNDAPDDDWESYLCRIDDAPASVFVDLALALVAPIASHGHVATVRVPLRIPRDDGLSHGDEFDALCALEDALTAALTRDGEAVFVGRTTTGGHRESFFYVRRADGWPARVARAMAPFRDYTHAASVRADADWSVFRDFLYPDVEDLGRIYDRRVCDALRRHGDALTAPRPIDHQARFPDAASRARFVAAIAPLGFAVDTSDAEDGELPFCVELTRTDVPDPATIDELTSTLRSAAADAGGDYDGWGTAAIAGAPDSTDTAGA